MKNTTFFSLFSIALLFISCNANTTQSTDKIDTTEVNNEETESDKIQVLNLGTFHMGSTSDQHKTEFDENDDENKRAVHQIAEKIAAFKPTVIIVELTPKGNVSLQKEYEEYLLDPSMKFDFPSEIELLAYEVGRLTEAKRIYGIDHKMDYDYMINERIDNQIDTATYKHFEKILPEKIKEMENLTLSEKLKFLNTDSSLDFFLFVNADILTHTGTKGNFEGADEAAKYYQRNLRMYSNLNRIPLKKEDRIFILMGASHTAFFRDFMSRSTKYEMVNTLSYLE
ncbi:MAG: DUF5694 domain-containing protein [Bacteroidota bacterium]